MTYPHWYEVAKSGFTPRTVWLESPCAGSWRGTWDCVPSSSSAPQLTWTQCLGKILMPLNLRGGHYLGHPLSCLKPSWQQNKTSDFSTTSDLTRGPSSIHILSNLLFPSFLAPGNDFQFLQEVTSSWLQTPAGAIIPAEMCPVLFLMVNLSSSIHSSATPSSRKPSLTTTQAWIIGSPTPIKAFNSGFRYHQRYFPILSHLTPQKISMTAGLMLWHVGITWEALKYIFFCRQLTHRNSDLISLECSLGIKT